jgi:hypothetical protein
MESFPVFYLLLIFDPALLHELLASNFAHVHCESVLFVAVLSSLFRSYLSSTLRRGTLSRLSSIPTPAVNPKAEL